MALPPGAAAALTSSMSKAGMGGGDAGPSDEPDDEGGEDAAYKQICGDVFDAVKNGDKEKFGQFMMELLERFQGNESGPESSPEMPESPEET